MRRLRDEAGYSLVEMVTVMAIMGVVFAGLTDIFNSASKADIRMQDRFTAQLNSRLALDKLRRDIHCAYDVSPNTPNPWTSSQSSLTLKITSCSGGDVTWCTASIGGSTTRYGFYRELGDSCDSTNGTKLADYLLTSTPFTAFAHVAGCGCLASVGVSIPVSVQGTSIGQYKLTDTIYLRNSTRI
jgi:prepilin-type N-terminal cleavage/methylation domain-containing protein